MNVFVFELLPVKRTIKKYKISLAGRFVCRSFFAAKYKVCFSIFLRGHAPSQPYTADVSISGFQSDKR